MESGADVDVGVDGVTTAIGEARELLGLSPAVAPATVVRSLVALQAARMTQAPSSAIDHPAHYGGDTTYEAIRVIEAWELGFCLGNTVKYVARAGKKAGADEVEDLEKAAWYLNRAITQARAKR